MSQPVKSTKKGVQQHPGKVAPHAPPQPSTRERLSWLVYHTPQRPREPLTTLVAELYGDPSTPAPQPPADLRTTDERWQDAVTQVAEQLRATLRVEVLPDRLHKALALVLIHAVTLHPDGTASVQSGKQTYTLAPECPCADATPSHGILQTYAGGRVAPPGAGVLDGTAPAPVSSTTASAVAAPAGAAPRPALTHRQRPRLLPRTPARTASPAPTAGRSPRRRPAVACDYA